MAVELKPLGPKLPSPMVDPERVAEAIREAATAGERDVKVGTLARINTTAAKLVPGLADEFSARQADRQQEDYLPINPAGILYQPSHTGRIHGESVQQHA